MSKTVPDWVHYVIEHRAVKFHRNGRLYLESTSIERVYSTASTPNRAVLKLRSGYFAWLGETPLSQGGYSLQVFDSLPELLSALSPQDLADFGFVKSKPVINPAETKREPPEDETKRVTVWLSQANDRLEKIDAEVESLCQSRVYHRDCISELQRKVSNLENKLGIKL